MPFYLTQQPLQVAHDEEALPVGSVVEFEDADDAQDLVLLLVLEPIDECADEPAAFIPALAKPGEEGDRAAPPPPPPPPPPPKPLARMNVAELLERAKADQVTVAEGATKAVIIAAIEAKANDKS